MVAILFGPAGRGRGLDWVYPRVYGGTTVRVRLVVAGHGLSPRVRGNQSLTMAFALGVGSIPACTGEPTLRRAAGIASTVYPRVYGGTRLGPLGIGGMGGLSPRVRGNRNGNALAGRLDRSIPACTGEPSAIRAVKSATAVYPRVYGGTCPGQAFPYSAAGLSPRVRGNLFARTWFRPLNRSIPACTGEPAGCPVPSLLHEVYPRVYGGTLGNVWNDDDEVGLSPRVRGNPRTAP